MNLRRSAVCLLILAAIAWLLYPWAKEFAAIDCCLDRGGRWNYETKECEYADTKPADADADGASAATATVTAID